jgi:cytochrome c556
MIRLVQTASALAIALAISAPATWAAEENKDVIEYRQNMMKTFGAQSAAIGAIMQNKIPHKDNVALHADIIAATAKAAVKAFEANAPGGDAKPEIWAQWSDFSGRMLALATAAETVAKNARAGNMEQKAVMGMFTCRGCHDIYRAK